MQIHWVNALVKTILFFIVVHIIFFILGYFFPNNTGIFNLPMMWAHWSNCWGSSICGIILAIIIYLIIYYKFSGGKSIDSSENH